MPATKRKSPGGVPQPSVRSFFTPSSSVKPSSPGSTSRSVSRSSSATDFKCTSPFDESSTKIARSEGSASIRTPLASAKELRAAEERDLAAAIAASLANSVIDSAPHRPAAAGASSDRVTSDADGDLPTQPSRPRVPIDSGDAATHTPPSPPAASAPASDAPSTLLAKLDELAGGSKRLLEEEQELEVIESADDPVDGPVGVVAGPDKAGGISTDGQSATSFAQSSLSSYVSSARKDKEGNGEASTSNAFSHLMRPSSDALLWAQADVVEADNHSGPAKMKKALRKAPFYKVLEGMPLSVDGFRFGNIEGCKGWFLSHFHSDHYVGLSNSWTHGPIYCSAETASLVQSSLKVAAQYVVALPFDEPYEVPNSGGVIVTPIRANHCPGSCLFHFRGPQTAHILPPPPGGHHPPLRKNRLSTYLHCGDFRACPEHVRHPTIRRHRLDIIYLDTTYCNARYCFPPQPLVIDACGQLVANLAPNQAQGPDVDLTKQEEDWSRPYKSATALLKEEKQKVALKEEASARSAMGSWLGRRSPLDDPKVEGAQSAARSALPDATSMDTATAAEEAEAELWAAAHGGLDELIDGGFMDEVNALQEMDAQASQTPDEEVSEDTLQMQLSIKQEPLEGEVARPPLMERGTSNAFIKQEDATDSGLDSVPKPAQDAFTVLGAASKQEGTMTNYAASEALLKTRLAESSKTGRLLVVCGTYTIGKEKIVLAAARALRSKVYCSDPRKYAVYAQVDEPELHARLTRDPLAASVHVHGLSAVNGEALRALVASLRKMGGDFDRAVAFRPTGWTYKPPAGLDTTAPNLRRLIEYNQSKGFSARDLQPTRDSSRQYAIYGVPYSEHSSFFELTAFALSIDYDRIIPTVNVGNPTSRAKMKRWFERWAQEKKRRGGQAVVGRADTYF
ncbi:DRMBL-domain-containing protein [Ceraceosorus guamensis]|uniref:DRMBL-domain-containing protein n=1 Tax=Ceraceosorus guamensis TaxID=1522189 RepID=A0A316W810_9BASI|nr:DRMBL-domain-containing protein [Ceraceosorus guamensis]PWN43805.1 DRMBL-domain-containing protein [Ceraceosorus guamensis]